MKGVFKKINYYIVKKREMYYIKTMAKIFKCDVRKNVRYKMEGKGHSKIDGYYMNLHDLSVGGLTFFNPHKMIQKIKGDVLSDMTLLVRTEAFKIPQGKVVRRGIGYCSGGKSQFLLAIKLLDLSDKTTQNIYKKINGLIFLEEKYLRK